MQIAEHFGWDVAEIREFDYQPGTYSPKVYAGFDDPNYWSAGPRPPRYLGPGGDCLSWRRVESTWKGNGPLWVADGSKVT